MHYGAVDRGQGANSFTSIFYFQHYDGPRWTDSEDADDCTAGRGSKTERQSGPLDRLG